VWIHQLVKNLEGGLSSRGKNLTVDLSSGAKILVWIHQVAIVLLNLD
jgi:hypothetical protein